jgi:hypothetical protein
MILRELFADWLLQLFQFNLQAITERTIYAWIIEGLPVLRVGSVPQVLEEPARSGFWSAIAARFLAMLFWTDNE